MFQKENRRTRLILLAFFVIGLFAFSAIAPLENTRDTQVVTPEIMIEENHIQSALDFSALWNKTYGGFSSDRFDDIVHCADGGFAIVGTTHSFGTGNGDIWVVKTNNNGDVLWTTTLYEDEVSSNSIGKAIIECENGDFVVVGASYITSDYDGRVERLDADGNSIWSILIGAAGTADQFVDVIETSSGNILALGRTQSWGAGDHDILAVCLTSNGDEIWTRTYGGANYEWAYEVVESSSGGYAILAETASFGAGAVDFWLLRVDEYGNLLWNQTYGRSNSETASDLIECSVGGFIMAGTSRSHGDSSGDFWAIKVDDLGIESWNQTYTGAGVDYATAIVEAANGGYAIVGVYDDMSPAHSVRLIRIELDGTERWTHWYDGPFYDFAYGLIETYPEEFVFVGFTDSYGAGSWDAWLVLVPGEPQLTDPPDELHFEFGHAAGVILWAESSAPIHKWWLEDTSVFNIVKNRDSEGSVYRLVPPNVGYYEVWVHVNNTAGHETEHIFFIYVEDTTAPTWTTFSADHIMEFGDQFQYTPVANDLSGLSGWSLIGSMYFTIGTTSSQITNVGTPPIGNYYLEVSVEDIYSNTLTEELHILVQDTTAPEWDETPEDQLAMFGCQFVYDLNASDLAGISAWWVDNTEFSVDSVGRVRNLVTLAPGYHSVTIYVSDINGNILQGEFNVRVDSPLMTTGTISEPGIISSVIPFAAGVIAAVVVVAIVVYIFGRRKPPAK